jgi:hypothetical protein
LFKQEQLSVLWSELKKAQALLPVTQFLYILLQAVAAVIQETVSEATGTVVVDAVDLFVASAAAL